MGNRVLSHCEHESVKKGFDSLFLEVFLDNRARILYERLGYKTYKLTDSHYMMKKRLNNETEQIN